MRNAGENFLKKVFPRTPFQKLYYMGLLKKFHFFNSPFASGGILTAGCDDFGVFAGVFS